MDAKLKAEPIATPYPLQWPPGFPRTPKAERAKGHYRTELATAINGLRKELELLGGRLAGDTLVVSTNVTLLNAQPNDPGVVAYFIWNGRPLAIPCDRWLNVASNVQAIKLTIEAMRGLERHGAKAMIDAMFAGFRALPGPESWRAVLKVGPDADFVAAIEAHRRLARDAHPDRGGSDAAMSRLNVALDTARKEIGGG